MCFPNNDIADIMIVKIEYWLHLCVNPLYRIYGNLSNVH